VGLKRSEQASPSGYKNSDLLEENADGASLPWWDFWSPLHAHSQGFKIEMKAHPDRAFLHRFM
jgi:hypothetical protein